MESAWSAGPALDLPPTVPRAVGPPTPSEHQRPLFQHLVRKSTRKSHVSTANV